MLSDSLPRSGLSAKVQDSLKVEGQWQTGESPKDGTEKAAELSRGEHAALQFGSEYLVRKSLGPLDVPSDGRRKENGIARRCPFGVRFPIAWRYLQRLSHQDTLMTRHSTSSSSPDETRRLRSTLKEKKRNIEINDAFEKLQKQLPHVPSSTRLPKIKTLRLALKYIEHLNTILSGDKQIRNSYTDRARSEERSTNGNVHLMPSSSTSPPPPPPPLHELGPSSSPLPYLPPLSSASTATVYHHHHHQQQPSSAAAYSSYQQGYYWSSHQ
ncbi:unnamed protein product [Heligmosomoides polygyrus]|uniref:BHLH domain-containing protein n=1 Tax=Heligmosomoides polygyrus TaxID=6339 RepID=A0A3P7ZJB9_HELPZ|nr:unnamed protein product [Heligmosomoides polygyrus]